MQLVVDLFGELTLIRTWGALHSHRGGMRITAVASEAEAQAAFAEIAQRRRQRGTSRP